MSEVTVKLKSLSVREKEYLNNYQKLYIKLYNTSEKLEGALEALALNFEDLDCIKLQEIIETLVEAKYLNNITTPHDDFLLDAFFKIFKENIVKPKINLLLKFSDNSNSFSYVDLKYREPYLLAKGNDGYLRIFKYENKKEQSIYLKEKISGIFGIDNKKEKLTYLKEILEKATHYDLLDKYLFLSQDNKLIVINLETNKSIESIKFSNITGIEHKDNKIFLITDKFAEGLIAKNDKLSWERPDDHKIEASYQNYVNLGSFLVYKNKKTLLEIPPNLKENNSNIEIKKIILLSDNNFEGLNSVKSKLSIESIYSKESKSLVDYIKNDNYLTLIFSDSLTHYKFEKEGAKAIFHLTGKELKRKEGLNKTIPNNLRMYVFEDGFVILKVNKVYGTENWKNYVQFVEGLEVKEYSKWESYYDNAWCPELFEEL